VIELVEETTVPEPVTHRDLCRRVARWFLSLAWCDVVCWELGGYLLEGEAARRQTLTLEQAVVERETVGASVHDVVALMTPTYQRELPRRRRGRVPLPRLAVAEVKRTRADLLGDLRAGKLLKYQAQASHCYLAAHVEALGVEQNTMHRPGVREEALHDLEMRGLPRTWGVLVLTNRWRRGKNWIHVESWRNPKRLPTVVTESDRHNVTRQIARSLAYRVLGPESPMDEQAG
jgi:hypothetical protein